MPVKEAHIAEGKARADCKQGPAPQKKPAQFVELAGLRTAGCRQSSSVVGDDLIPAFSYEARRTQVACAAVVTLSFRTIRASMYVLESECHIYDSISIHNRGIEACACDRNDHTVQMSSLASRSVEEDDHRKEKSVGTSRFHMCQLLFLLEQRSCALSTRLYCSHYLYDG